MNLQTLIEERQEVEDTYKDQVLHINNDLLYVDKYGVVATEDFIFADTGLRQLCSWTNIPYAFFIKLSPDLKQQVLDEMVEKLENRKLMLRSEGQKVRGVLSDKYRIVNHTEVLTRVRDVVGSDREVTEVHFNAGLMSLRITEPSTSLNAGISIQNSELGECSIGVAPFIYRLVCSNGLIVATKEAIFKQVHSGTREYAMQDAIYEAFGIAETSRTLFELTKYKKLLPERIEEEINRVIKKIGLPNRIIPAVKSCYDEEPMPNGFGIINALTRYAKGTDLKERVAIETSASRLISLYSGN